MGHDLKGAVETLRTVLAKPAELTRWREEDRAALCLAIAELSRLQGERKEIAAFLVEQFDEPDMFVRMGERGHYWRDKCITAGQRLDPERAALASQDQGGGDRG